MINKAEISSYMLARKMRREQISGVVRNVLEDFFNQDLQWPTTRQVRRKAHELLKAKTSHPWAKSLLTECVLSELQGKSLVRGDIRYRKTKRGIPYFPRVWAPTNRS